MGRARLPHRGLHRVPPYIAPPQFCAREAAGAGAGDEMRTAASGRRRVGPGTKGVFEGLWRKNTCGPFRCFVMWSVCNWDRTARSWLLAGRSTFTGSEVDGRWPVRRPRPNGHQKRSHHLQPLGMTRANTQWARGVRWPSGHVRNSGSTHATVAGRRRVCRFHNLQLPITSMALKNNENIGRSLC